MGDEDRGCAEPHERAGEPPVDAFGEDDDREPGGPDPQSPAGGPIGWLAVTAIRCTGSPLAAAIRRSSATPFARGS